MTSELSVSIELLRSCCCLEFAPARHSTVRISLPSPLPLVCAQTQSRQPKHRRDSASRRSGFSTSVRHYRSQSVAITRSPPQLYHRGKPPGSNAGQRNHLNLLDSHHKQPPSIRRNPIHTGTNVPPTIENKHHDTHTPNAPVIRDGPVRTAGSAASIVAMGS